MAARAEIIENTAPREIASAVPACAAWIGIGPA
jgi:hypothetical protein